MSRTLDERFKARGTRFLVYPQSPRLAGFRRAQPVYVSLPPGAIRPGPEDDAIYVVDALDKVAYKESRGRPPYVGPRLPPAAPGPDGHFDHIRPDERAFSSATLYASVRCVLDIWESYLGRQLSWRLPRTGNRVEVIPRVETANAYTREDALEFGFDHDLYTRPFAENFDVVAHEVGHFFGWHLVGKPARRTMAYRANDEACADLVAIVSSLHFDAVVDHLLDHSKGDLSSNNVLSRIGELSRTRQARTAFNAARMSTLPKVADPMQYKFILARPFTGGSFDILVGVYERGLRERGALPSALRSRARLGRRDPAAVRHLFARSYRARPAAFREALLDARDYFGRLLTRALEKTPMHRRCHAVVAGNMLRADSELTGGRYRELIRDVFVRREIVRDVRGGRPRRTSLTLARPAH